jgi:hypothetical protein
LARPTYHAYVDESGVRALGPRTGDHFVLSAAILPDAEEATARAALASLRSDFGLPPNHVLHFQKLAHTRRVRACQVVGALSDMRITNVVVCKRYFGSAFLTSPITQYLFTLRLLLERISWYVDSRGGQAYVTFAHIKGFKVADLHNYIAILQSMPTEIRWGALYVPLRMDQPSVIELLQMADTVASATAQAFEPDDFGNTERRYVTELAGCLYRYPGSPITTYGMKLHPKAALSVSDYAWVSAL